MRRGRQGKNPFCSAAAAARFSKPERALKVDMTQKKRMYTANTHAYRAGHLIHYDHTNFRQESFADVVDDIFAVYTDADDVNVLETPIPEKFHEVNPSNIVLKFHELDSDKVAKGATTTITARFEKKKYRNDAYALYHDLTVACATLIVQSPVGSDVYFDVDFFYRFCTELLLRELHRLHESLPKPKHEEEPLELQAQLFEDFSRISHGYVQGDDEVVTITHREENNDRQQSPYAPLYQAPVPPKLTLQPLFSSLLGKSSLDNRPTVVGGEYSVAKVVPQNRVANRGQSTLDQISPGSNRIPTPSELQHHSILHDFFHPTWYTIPIPTWLTYKGNALKPASSLPETIRATAADKADSDDTSKTHHPKLALLQRGGGSNDKTTTLTVVDVPGDMYRLFAPTTAMMREDMREDYPIVTPSYKASIWLQHLGWKEIQEIKKQQKEAANGKTDEDADDSSNAAVDKLLDPEEFVDLSGWRPLPLQDSEKNPPINLAHLVNWDPARIVQLEQMKRDRAAIVELASLLQRLISTNLLKLNKLRNARYANSDPRSVSSPGDEEKRVYNRIAKLVTLAITKYQVLPSEFKFGFSKQLAVLTEEFGGVLPGVTPPKPAPYPMPSNRRLPNTRGPYKKRNRAV